MTPQEVWAVARPHLYGNPFWNDPVDAAADPLIRAAAAEVWQWEPVRRERKRIAIWTYVGLWVVEFFLLVGFFSRDPSEPGGEAWGVPAGIFFLVLIIFVPGLLAAWVDPAGKRVRQAVAAIKGGSVQRYQQWLAYVAQNDPVVHGQVVLWHQGNQANQLATWQLAVQAYTAYQVTQVRNDIRNNR